MLRQFRQGLVALQRRHGHHGLEFRPVIPSRALHRRAPLVHHHPVASVKQRPTTHHTVRIFWTTSPVESNGIGEKNQPRSQRSLIMPSTRPGVSRRKMMKMRPRSEKDSCSENQIRFSQDRFRFRQNVVLDHPLCGRTAMRTCQTSLQSSRLEFFTNPSSVRQHSGLQIAYV